MHDLCDTYPLYIADSLGRVVFSFCFIVFMLLFLKFIQISYQSLVFKRVAYEFGSGT